MDQSASAGKVILHKILSRVRVLLADIFEKDEMTIRRKETKAPKANPQQKSTSLVGLVPADISHHTGGRIETD